MKFLALLLALSASAPAASYYLTIAGLGGEPEYDKRFTALAQEIDKLLKASAGAARVETFTGAGATKTKVAETVAAMAKAATPQDLLVVTLIGHGTFDGIDYKFNLTGPDLSAMDLAGLLDKFPGQQLVVNTTSASGACLGVLKKSGRAVIAATKSGTERNATVFARYWTEALRVPSSDADKNEVITAAEAYRYANEKTAKFYDQLKRIATEHSMMEDTGKGDPVRDPSVENGQGLLLSRFALLRLGAAQTAAGTPEKKKLLEKKETLEQEIASLKYKKASLASDEYMKQLTALLIQLSATQAELDK